MSNPTYPPRTFAPPPMMVSNQPTYHIPISGPQVYHASRPAIIQYPTVAVTNSYPRVHHGGAYYG